MNSKESFIFINPVDKTKKYLVQDENGNLKEKEQKVPPREAEYDYIENIDDETKKKTVVKCKFFEDEGKWKAKTFFGWKEIDKEKQQELTAAYFESLSKNNG